jgi:hypothetical protein
VNTTLLSLSFLLYKRRSQLTSSLIPPGESADAFNQVQNTDDDHKGSLTHELIAGAAAFFAFKKFEDSKRAEGMFCACRRM